VVPLTVTPANSDELLGGAGNSSPHGDAIATRVLVKGEPVPAPPGRADDFVLQRGNEANVPPVAATPAGALASAPADTPSAAPAAVPEKQTATPPKTGAGSKTTQNSAAKPKAPSPPPPRRDDVPRPPRGIFGSGGSQFGVFR
jgi:uncharacterized protein